MANAELASDEVVCGWCGDWNDFVDDIGAFWCCPVGKDQRPTCKSCYEGDVGRLHEQRWGVGDR